MKTEAERILALATEREEFVADVDGYVYYWPAGFNGGHFSAFHLRTLADELDRRNAAWDAQVREDLAHLRE